MLVKFDSRRQSDAYQVKQDANRSASGGYRNFQKYRAEDSKDLTPAELEQIRLAHITRKNLIGR